MVIESEIKPERIERRGGVRRNQRGRTPNFPDASTTRKSVVLPDDIWGKLHEMYPDTSSAMLFYRFITDNDDRFVAP